jgi:molecular chaperone GrpE
MNERPEDLQEEAAPAAAPTPEAEPLDEEGLRAALRESREQAQSYLGSWQRAAADYQNLKRRMEQERAEIGRLANAALTINLLPLLDDLERALHTVDVKLAGLTWIDGVWLIYRKFQAVLENAGVKEILADGQPFDPNVHEAISEAPGEPGTVVSVVQKGYTLGDRVIRPAMVIVGKRDAGGETREAGDETWEGDTQADVSG